MSDAEDPGLSRRDLMRVAAGGAALALLPSAGIAAGDTVSATGSVFERAGDSRRGLPGVLVSNGRDVVATGPDGRWTLPVSDETVLFVIKPAGYMTPVDPVTQLPRFFYVHQPAGSPADLNLTYPGIAPTGPLPASIDFELARREEPSRFEVVLFTDPQPESDAEVDFVREDVIDLLAGTTAAFGITAGDIMFDDLSLYDRLNRIVGTIGIPWYTVGGNHDLNFEAAGRRYSRETYKRVYGPTDYAFAYGDTVFVMLDDVEYLGPDAKTPSGAKYQGRLSADQLAFVANVLAHVPADKLVVTVLHIPLRNALDPVGADVNLTNRAELFALFKDRRFTVSFSGHTHTTEHHYFDGADGWPSPVPHHHHVLTAVSGSWWSGPADHRGVAVADSRDGSPNGFHILSVDGTAYTTRFVPAKEPGGRQIRLTVESHAHGSAKEVMKDFRPGALIKSPVALAAVPSTTLVANVFDGGPKTQVTARIGGHASLPMRRVARPDPLVTELFARNDASKKPWVKAEVSSHIWTVRLPPDLQAGTHRVLVEAVNEYGATVRAAMALEVA